MREIGLFIDDKSFFIFKEEKPVAIAILIFSKDPISNLIQAKFPNDPLPWPIIIDDCEDRKSVNEIIFNEIHKRIKINKVSKINFLLNTANYSKEIEDEFNYNLIKYNMIDKSYYSHLVKIDDDVLKKVRSSYLKNIKKNDLQYSIRIIQRKEYYENLASEYKALHILDAGKEFRSLKTYELQLESIKNNKAFAIQVISDEDELIGMLIIYYENNSAYDGSVAVKPAYKKYYISHILKYYAILHLEKINIRYYELGKAALKPSYNWLPNEKNYGISFFKNGWSNNAYKKVFEAEKFYSQEALRKSFDNNFKNLIEFFKI